MSPRKTEKEYLAFPAIFEADPEDEGAVNFEFPDLESCFGNARSLNEALVEAKEALENVLVWMEKDGYPIPEATPLDELPSRKGAPASLVVADMRAARRSWEERAVNRTVTLPGWLDQEARRANLNFSQVLQEGLKERLRV